MRQKILKIEGIGLEGQGERRAHWQCVRKGKQFLKGRRGKSMGSGVREPSVARSLNVVVVRWGPDQRLESNHDFIQEGWGWGLGDER